VRSRASDIATALLALANVIVIGFIVWEVGFADDGAQTRSAPVEVSRHDTPPPRTESRPVVVRQVSTPAPAAVRVTITAARGNCWISARRGRATGPVLAEKTLLHGDTLTVRGRRIWLELGAAGNVDVSVNGHPRPIRSGTTDLVLG